MKDALGAVVRRARQRLGGAPLWRDALALSVLGALCRFGCVLWADSRFPPAADGKFYDVVARRIAEGLGYTWLWPDGAVTYAAHYPVGYPAIVGGLYALFGPDPLLAMLLNATLGTLAVMATYWLCARVVPRVGALFGGAVVAIHPSLVLYTPALMTEGVTAALYVLAAWLALAASRRRGLGHVALLGLLLGAVVLVRPQSMLLVPLFGAAAAHGSPQAGAARPGGASAAWWSRSLLVTLLSLVVCLPWTYRNCQRMDRCVFVSANGGWNLLIGTAAEAKGGFIAVDQMGVPPACREVFEEAAKDACFGAAAVERIRDRPLAWLGLVFAKWGATFDYPAAPAHYLRMSNPAVVGEAASAAIAAVETLWQRALIALSLLGFGGLAGPWRRVRRGVASLAALSLLSPFAWPALLALLGLSALSWRSLLVFRPLGLGASVLGATVLIHAVFFGAGRYSLVGGFLAGVLAASCWGVKARQEDRTGSV